MFASCLHALLVALTSSSTTRIARKAHAGRKSDEAGRPRTRSLHPRYEQQEALGALLQSSGASSTLDGTHGRTGPTTSVRNLDEAYCQESNRLVQTRMLGGVRGVPGQPGPLSRSLVRPFVQVRSFAVGGKSPDPPPLSFSLAHINLLICSRHWPCPEHIQFEPFEIVRRREDYINVNRCLAFHGLRKSNNTATSIGTADGQRTGT